MVIFYALKDKIRITENRIPTYQVSWTTNLLSVWLYNFNHLNVLKVIVKTKKLFYFSSGAGLKCYTCGWWSKDCGDPFLKDDYLLVECNTRAINDFNHELGNTINLASNALQNFANQVGFNLNQHSSFNNLPSISEDSVGCSKVVLKRTC